MVKDFQLENLEEAVGRDLEFETPGLTVTRKVETGGGGWTNTVVESPVIGRKTLDNIDLEVRGDVESLESNHLQSVKGERAVRQKTKVVFEGKGTCKLENPEELSPTLVCED